MQSDPKIFDNRYLRALIIPLLIETLLSVTIGAMDTMMVSTVGEHAVSGVSLVDSISNLFVFLFSAFSTGGAVVASQYLGKKERESSCFASKQLIYVSAAFSILVAAILIIFRRTAMEVVYGSIEESVMDAALAYFLPILLSFPFLALLNSCNAIFRAMGKSRITMTVSIIMNVINISGNALLIYVFDMGTAGAGIASLLSRIAACCFMLYKVTRKDEIIHVDRILKVEIDFRMIARIMRIALPSGIENSVFHIGKILVSSTVASLGTASIAANAVFNSLSTFANIPGSAVGMAAVAVIGQCCGARDYDAAFFYGKKLLRLIYMMMGATCLAMYVLTPEITWLYNLSPEADALAIQASRLAMIQSALFWPLAFGVPNFLRAAGDARFTMVVSILSMWIFRVALSYLLIKHFGFGVEGVWYSMYADWAFRGVLYFLRYKGGKWKEKAVI